MFYDALLGILTFPNVFQRFSHRDIESPFKKHNVVYTARDDMRLVDELGVQHGVRAEGSGEERCFVRPVVNDHDMALRAVH